MARRVGRYSGHGQLTGLDRLRLTEPGEVDFFDQVSEGFGLELGATKPFFDSHDEYLIGGLNSQPIQLFKFRLSYHLAVLLFEWGFRPHMLLVPAIWHNCS